MPGVGSAGQGRLLSRQDPRRAGAPPRQRSEAPNSTWTRQKSTWPRALQHPAPPLPSSPGGTWPRSLQHLAQSEDQVEGCGHAARIAAHPGLHVIHPAGEGGKADTDITLACKTTHKPALKDSNAAQAHIGVAGPRPAWHCHAVVG